MASITLPLPDAFNGNRFTKEQKRRLSLSLLPDLAEVLSLSICEKYFKCKFVLGAYNSKGYDIVSEDGKYVVEVKQTSRLKQENILRIQNVWHKKDICTHILVFDFYNTSNRCSIIPNGEFFNSDFDKGKHWLWDAEYGKGMLPKWNRPSKRCNENTQLFLKYEVEL